MGRHHATADKNITQDKKDGARRVEAGVQSGHYLSFPHAFSGNQVDPRFGSASLTILSLSKDRGDDVS